MKKKPRTPEKKLPTLDELEAMLNTLEDVPVEILPNGEMRVKGTAQSLKLKQKPVTLREDLGNEYAFVG